MCPLPRGCVYVWAWCWVDWCYSSHYGGTSGTLTNNIDKDLFEQWFRTLVMLIVAVGVAYDIKSQFMDQMLFGAEQFELYFV